MADKVVPFLPLTCTPLHIFPPSSTHTSLPLPSSPLTFTPLHIFPFSPTHTSLPLPSSPLACTPLHIFPPSSTHTSLASLLRLLLVVCVLVCRLSSLLDRATSDGRALRDAESKAKHSEEAKGRLSGKVDLHVHCDTCIYTWKIMCIAH